MITSYYRNWI